MTGTGFESEKINRFFKGDYSEKDESYIDEVFCDDSKKEELKHLLHRQFYELMSEDEVNEKNLDHILHRIHYNINTRLSSHRILSFDNIIKWTYRIAGIIILPLLFILGMQIYKGNSSNKNAWVEIKAPAWTRAQFRLPDGTTGWLNSNSSIKYYENFTADRQVTLNGEAFFEVAKDKKRPFTVTTPDINVKVLGTKFNIASYGNEKIVEVVLEEGKLEFNDRELKKSYVMRPNDLVIFDKMLKEISTQVVQTQKYLSWTEGKLVFRNDPLDVIARRLERWYNIDVEVNVKSAENIRWHATFVDENVEEVLKLMKRSLNVNYSVVDGNLQQDGTFTKKKVIFNDVIR